MSDRQNPRAPEETPAPKFVAEFCDVDRRRWILIAAILASSMGFIDGSVVSIAIPAMRESLDASLTQVQWIHTSYLLILSAFVLVGGAAGDRFGLGRVFGAGIVLFVAASMVCAAAPSAEILIPARAIQGLGAAAMVPGSLAIISRAYPREQRGAAIGLWAAASAVTTAAGPIVGGLVLSLGGVEMWRWIFAVNLPFGAVAIWLLIRAINHDPARTEQGVDVIGGVLAVIALGGIAWSVTAQEGKVIWSYLILGLAALLAFIWVESRHRSPMIELGLFASRAFSSANLMTFTFYFGFSTIMFFLPMTVIAGWGLSEFETAVAFFPLSIFIGALSSTMGKLADRFGARPLLTIGCLIMSVAFVGLALAVPTQNFWWRVVPATSLMGFGMAFVVAPVSTAVMTSVEDHNTGAASGINNAVARMAGLLSIATMGSLAAWIYTNAGGPLSFGLSNQDTLHVASINKAFAVLAYTSAGLSGFAAAVSWMGLPAATQGKFKS